MHSAVGSYAVALWWGCKLSSVLPGEKDSPADGGCILSSLYYQERKFPGRWGCMLSSLYYQERKIPRQVGLQAELFILVN